MSTERFDAIVVGAGAGGGIVACVLAEAGKRVLLLERGDFIDFQSSGRDHLRNHRLSQYGHNTGPDLEGNPRVYVDPDGRARVVRPHEGGYNANAAGVGSGTAVYGGQAWRFHPLDFRMATTYGVPEGSSLADWPIGYEDLEPFYERAEWTIGVCGGPPPPQMPPRRAYPMPPIQETKKTGIVRGAADRLGWKTQFVPLLVNSVERDGRPACTHCQHCVGFACPVDAKNGTQNTVIKRALATGNCTLRVRCHVAEVTTDAAGQVNGVAYFCEGERIHVESEVVVLSCGAIETARLLLNSRSAHHPDGLGNGHDQVGRNLQGHVYTGATGVMPEPVYDGIGPGPTVATLEFNHGNEDIVGGGMLCDEFISMPLMFLKNDRPAWVPTWGKAHKDWMRTAYQSAIQIRGPIHEIPSAQSRVMLDPMVRDKFGLPVARLSGTTHRESARIAEFMRRKAELWLSEAGATSVWSHPVGIGLSAGQHQAGTCRMGDDPKISAVDAKCRVHGHDNLFIGDSSVHTTNGGFNPVLTVMALAFRTADTIVKEW